MKSMMSSTNVILYNDVSVCCMVCFNWIHDRLVRKKIWPAYFLFSGETSFISRILSFDRITEKGFQYNVVILK